MTTSGSVLGKKIAEALASQDLAGHLQILEQIFEVDACQEVAVAPFNAGGRRLAADFHVRTVNSHVPSGKRIVSDENLLALRFMQSNDLADTDRSEILTAEVAGVPADGNQLGSNRIERIEW